MTGLRHVGRLTPTLSDPEGHTCKTAERCIARGGGEGECSGLGEGRDRGKGVVQDKA